MTHVRPNLRLYLANRTGVLLTPVVILTIMLGLSLIALARRCAPRVVASIFVNPTQFAPHEDFDSYPRHPERDAALLSRAGCDLLFIPDRETIYPDGFGTWIEPQGAALGLESEVRPHFFRGVATVVARLFALVQPDIAVFGEKDAQSPAERQHAALLSAALFQAKALFDRGERRSDVLREAVVGALAAEPEIVQQYVEVVHPDSFVRIAEIGHRALVALAAKVGSTRLIDNIRLDG